MNPLYVVLELGATTFFIIAAAFALRRGRLPFLELVSAAMFGILLEEGDQLIFETYEYASEWILAIDRAPVVIGLTWALIIAGAMRITDAFGVRRRYAPFVDSVLVLMLDLAFDAVAIRMGLWTWREVGPADGWLGVPAGNFYSWLFVTLGFSLFTRHLRDAAWARPALEWLQLLVPIPAFIFLVACIIPFALVLPLVDPAPGGGLVLFGLTFAAFLAVAAWGVMGPDRGRPNGAAVAIVDLRMALVIRFAIHGFFLIALLWLGLAQTQPILLLISFVMIAAEVPLALLTEHRHATAVPHRPPIREVLPEA